MSDPRPPPPPIEESLRRMFAAIERLGESVPRALQQPPPRPPSYPPPPGERPRDPVRAVLDQVAWKIHEGFERQRIKEERRRQKELEREERRRRREEARQQKQPIVGVAMIIAAAFLAYLAGTGQPFWFAFIALGLFLGGAAQFGGRKALPQATAEAAPLPVASKAELDEAKRVDEIARQLIEEIEAGPDVLRQIVEKPEQTVEGLRKGYHAMAERERDLRARIRPEEQTRLTDERAALVAKRDRTTDDVTRTRYDDALRALDHQRSELSALITAADRIEAERTRLRYTLEGLLSQVVRARSEHRTGSSDVALKQSLERLSDEVGAVTDALEEVNAQTPPLKVR